MLPTYFCTGIHRSLFKPDFPEAGPISLDISTTACANFGLSVQMEIKHHLLFDASIRCAASSRRILKSSKKDQTVHFVWDSRNGTTSNPSSRGLHWRSLHQRIKFVAQQTQLWAYSLPAPQSHNSSSLSNVYQPLIQLQALC